jgi:hypothetical protein
MLIADELTGHDSKERKEIKERGGSMTLRYFDGHRLTALKEAVDRVTYPQIDVDSLIADASAAEPLAQALEAKHPAVWGTRAVAKKRRVRPRPPGSEAAE